MPDATTKQPKPPGFYATKRKAGMQEVRFWVHEDYKEELNRTLRSIISSIPPRDVLIGLMELRLVLEEQKSQAQA